MGQHGPPPKLTLGGDPSAPTFGRLRLLPDNRGEGPGVRCDMYVCMGVGGVGLPLSPEVSWILLIPNNTFRTTITGEQLLTIIGSCSVVSPHKE